MKKLNQKGLAEVALLGYVVVGLILFFVPNPVSSAVGIGIRPNKTVQTQSTIEKVDFIKRDMLGRPVAEEDGSYLTKTTITQAASDKDIQQKVSIWEQLRALPVLWLFLMFLGGAFPVVAGVMAKINHSIKQKFFHTTKEKDRVLEDAKKIVRGLDAAFATIPFTLSGLPGEINREQLSNAIIERMKMELRGTYNDSTKELVKSLKS